MVFLEGTPWEGGREKEIAVCIASLPSGLPWSGDVLGHKVAASIQEALAI